MNPEKVHNSVEETIRDYVHSRATKEGSLTFVSTADKRIEELSRLIVEAVMYHDDGRRRLLIEAKALQMGDQFTRYAIKNEVGVDEEVTVVKAETKINRTTIKYSRHDDSHGTLSLDSTFLISVQRPTKEDLARELGMDTL